MYFTFELVAGFIPHVNVLQMLPQLCPFTFFFQFATVSRCQLVVLEVVVGDVRDNAIQKVEINSSFKFFVQFEHFNYERRPSLNGNRAWRYRSHKASFRDQLPILVRFAVWMDF